MDINPANYPSRMFIRFLAETQIVADSGNQVINMYVKRLNNKAFTLTATPGLQFPKVESYREAGFNLDLSIKPAEPIDINASCEQENVSINYPSFDESLFEDICKTTFKAPYNKYLYQDCGNQEAAFSVEKEVAAEVIAAYRKIKKNSESSTIKSLNALLP